MNTVWLDDSMQPWASARAEAVAHEFSHLFAAVIEYAQAYMTVQAALESGGRPAAWRLLHAMGDAGLDFPTAFETAFGQSVEEIDTRARESWQADLTRPPMEQPVV